MPRSTPPAMAGLNDVLPLVATHATLDARAPAAIPMTCKALRQAMRQDAALREGVFRAAARGMAEAMCIALATTQTSWEKAFRETVWPARCKWSAVLTQGQEPVEARDFDVQVSVRFRPTPAHGARGAHRQANGAPVVPLHQ